MDISLMEMFVQYTKDGADAVLCTLVEEQGSTPRGVGASMLVHSDGKIDGTVGGGITEHCVIERALEMMRNGEANCMYREDLNATEAALSGAACGGSVSVFMQRTGTNRELVIFGAGHVGKAIAHMAAFCGFAVTTWDDRAEFANGENIPDGRVVCCPLSEFDDNVKMSPTVCVVVVTRGHLMDADVIKLLDGRNAHYIGVIGSRRKIAFVRERLLKEGVSAAHLDRLYQPIGLPIRAETPEEIAVSVMAEIIASKRGACLDALRECGTATKKQ